MQNILFHVQNQKQKNISLFVKKTQTTKQTNNQINATLALIKKNRIIKKTTNLTANKNIQVMQNVDDNLIIQKYINYKIKERDNNLYDPILNNKKILVLVATHTNTPLKLQTIKDNLNYFKNECIDIAIADSANLKYNSEIKKYSECNNIKYFEIPDDNTFGFGKWIYLLNNIDYKLYDYVIFTNDSFIIHEPISQFINLAVKSNVELFGYNDSTQRNYHYQSYLFSIKSDSVHKFIKMFNNIKHLLNDYEAAVSHMELNMTSQFNLIDCYLKIGHFPTHKTLNIFFTSDTLYNKLKEAKLLPFTKIKRLLIE